MINSPRISVVGDQLKLAFDGNPGHDIFLPLSEKGFAILIYILKQQEIVGKKTTIATKEEPIQYMVDEWLRQGNTIKKKKVDAPEDLTIEDLDL